MRRESGSFVKCTGGHIHLVFKDAHFSFGRHWANVCPLHQMFEEQYSELRLAGDAIAERVRSLGCIAPGSYGRFTKPTYLHETLAAMDASEMIAELRIRLWVRVFRGGITG